MQIGDLFLKFGIKGDETVNKALNNVKTGLGDVTDMSLEAKAGILGLMYGVEQLMKASMVGGNELRQLADATGLNIEMLQKYAWAATRAGVSTQEFTSVAAKLPNQVMDILQGNGALATAFKKLLPTGLEIEQSQLRGPEGPEYIMRQLSKAAQSPFNKSNKDYFRHVLNQVGFSDAMVGLFQSGTLLDDKNFKGAPLINDKMSGQLQRAYSEWERLGIITKHVMDNFSAKHGFTLAKDLEGLVVQVGKLADKMTILSEKFGFFEKLDHMFSGLANTLQLISEIMDKMTGNFSNKKTDLLYVPPGGEAVPGWTGSPAQKFFSAIAETAHDTFAGGPKDLWHSMDNLKGPYLNEPFGKPIEVNVNVDARVSSDGKIHPDSLKQFRTEMKKTMHDTFMDAISQTQGAAQ